MDIICAPSGIIDVQNCRQGIMDIAKAGFESILLDFSMYCISHKLENIGEMKLCMSKYNPVRISEIPEKMNEIVRPMLNQCRNNNIQPQIAYAPYLKKSTRRLDINELLLKLTRESIKVALQAGCRYIVVRPLFTSVSDEDPWNCNREYYLELAKDICKRDMIILLENQCRDMNGHLVRGICSDANEAANWIDELNNAVGDECFGFCMNMGTCSICGQNIYDFIITLGDRLKSVILRDCDGNHESSLLPFTSVNKGNSRTDWLNLIRGLRKICFDGPLVIDFSDTASAFSPIIRSQLVRLAKTVADYFKWQIEIETVLKKYTSRVLFGAGNMCRNYMKCYGDEFPPLFTCDNNKSRWGEQFEGLEIKSPEALRELPLDCAVFICNIYYKEIGQQLHEMGISNPIEYFNDEYMPSFYFDTLEYWKGEQS